jgi:hypothetical protein
MLASTPRPHVSQQIRELRVCSRNQCGLPQCVAHLVRCLVLRTAIHEVYPNRPEGELTPVSGLSARAVIVQNLIYGWRVAHCGLVMLPTPALADRHGGPRVRRPPRASGHARV